jgi:hypothetical protein
MDGSDGIYYRDYMVQRGVWVHMNYIPDFAVVEMWLVC